MTQGGRLLPLVKGVYAGSWGISGITLWETGMRLIWYILPAQSINSNSRNMNTWHNTQKLTSFTGVVSVKQFRVEEADGMPKVTPGLSKSIDPPMIFRIGRGSALESSYGWSCSVSVATPSIWHMLPWIDQLILKDIQPASTRHCHYPDIWPRLFCKYMKLTYHIICPTSVSSWTFFRKSDIQ